MAKEIFNREQIQIVAEDVGGSKGRSILSFKKDGSVYMRKNSEKFFL
jgi:chemotaxis receptor (MCP) glutamine deamidase CheD